jgi:hypothetical protein
VKQRWKLALAERDGVPLVAPVEYWQMPEEERNLIAGGCGPGGFGDALVPDTLWGLSVRAACEIHDWMYHFGESIDDKRLADRLFLDNMVSIICTKTKNWILRKLRLQRAWAYYQAVAKFGGPSFHGIA